MGIDTLSSTSGVLAVPRSFECQCGRPVFFRNSLCVACRTPLGYDATRSRLLPLEPGPEAGTWQRFGASAAAPTGEAEPVYVRCANFDTAAGCNWLLERQPPEQSDAPAFVLCRSCRLNRTIPDLSVPGIEPLWRRIESAKRRLVSSLLGLGLPVRSRVSEDSARGLAFDLLGASPGGPSVMTGHDDGIVTINIDEADDALRESTRISMNEPYRTVLGHLRHEVGHYYWYRLVDGTVWQEPYRTLFGDERADYGASLRRHHQSGPAADWWLANVSAYASSHPWEDWAETWAHYLHMVDTLDTAASFGLHGRDTELHYEVFTEAALYRPDAPEAGLFLEFVNEWVKLSGVLNELARSMGQTDAYPFVLSVPVVGKLQFVHLLVAAEAGRIASPFAP